ncbi:MAG: Ig-like domain-containing protein, partial [bacterium]|nr:Ig-like domain-containing protein [bacterium]
MQVLKEKGKLFSKSIRILLGVTIMCCLVFSEIMAVSVYAGPNAGASIAVDLDVVTPGIQSTAIVLEGSNLQVDVILQEVSNLRGVNFDLLYDSGAVKVLSVKEGDFLGSTGEDTFFAKDTANSGTINVSAVILGLEATCVNDTGVVARITFEIIGTQDSKLDFNNVILGDCPNTLPNDNITSNAISGIIVVFPPPKITITSPVGGENWTGGSSHNIAWTITKGIAPYTIDLSYSTDGGGSYTNIVSGLNQAVAGAGSYPWNSIPPINSTNVTVMAEVTGSNSFTDTDVSNAFSIDSTRPTVSTTTPAPGATNQALNASLQVNFSEAVDNGSAQAAFSINPNPGGLSFNWNGGWTVMTINHNSFAPGTTYNLTITTGLKDLSDPGNNMASDTSWSFTTAQALSIGLTSPNGGQDWTGGESHPVNYTITGGAAPYTAGLYYSTNGGTSWIGPSDTHPAVSGANTYTWLTPSVNSGQVRVKVVVTDSSSQSAEDTSDANFTIDSTRPQVTAVNPPDGAAGVPITTSIKVGFNESMDQTVTQGAFSISPEPGNLSFSWAGDTMTVTHDPFTYATTYHCTISTQARDDSNTGNSLAASYTWQFTTVPRLVVDLTSPNGGEDWTGGELHPVNYTVTGGVAPYTAGLYYSTNGGTSWIGPSDTHPAVSGANTYSWPTPSINSAQVRVKVVISDGSNQQAEDASPADFTIDSTAPIVTGTTPGSDAINVPIGTEIVINFTESMDPASTGAVSITPAVTNLSYAWDADTNTLTITHNPFTHSTTYHCTVSTQARDNSNTGNPLAVPYTWSFTTAGLLDVQVGSPNGGENWTGGSSHDITWVINGGTPPYRVGIQLSADSGATYGDTFAAVTQANTGSGSYSWTVNIGDTTTLRMRVPVTDAGSQSDSDASEADFAIDSTKPTITTISPTNGDTGVQTGRNIIITFSEAMKKALTEGAFSISPNPGGLAYLWNGDTLTITHSSFAYGTTYTCTVSTAAKDTSDPGNS